MAVTLLSSPAVARPRGDRATPGIEASVAAAVEAGATVLAPAMPLGPLGSTAVLVDPAGAVFGLWEAGELRGFGRYDEPGSEVADLLDPTGAPFKLHSGRLKNPPTAQEPQLS